MKLKPIAQIRNVFLRRLLTIIVVPLFLVFGGLFLMPAAAVLDTMIALVKVLIKFPKYVYQVERTVIGICAASLKEGWYGQNPFAD